MIWAEAKPDTFSTNMVPSHSAVTPVKLVPSPENVPSNEPLNEPLCSNPLAAVVATIFPVPFIAVVDKLPAEPPPITT